MSSLDKWGRDYAELLRLQATQLQRWSTFLKPEVHAKLVALCREVNRPVYQPDLDAYHSLKVYKAGGLHVCPVGFELNQLLEDPQSFQEQTAHMLRSTSAVVQAEVTRQRKHTMSNIKKQFAIIAAAFAVLAEEFNGSSAPAADPRAALVALAARKDPKLVEKVLKKAGEDSIEGVADDDIADITSKIEALDDAEGAPAGGSGGKVTMDALKALAQELITDGKADALKKIVTKHGAKKVSELAEKEFAAVHEKFLALKD